VASRCARSRTAISSPTATALPPRDYFTDEIRRQLSRRFRRGGVLYRAMTCAPRSTPRCRSEAAHALRASWSATTATAASGAAPAETPARRGAGRRGRLARGAGRAGRGPRHRPRRAMASGRGAGGRRSISCAWASRAWKTTEAEPHAGCRARTSSWMRGDFFRQFQSSATWSMCAQMTADETGVHPLEPAAGARGAGRLHGDGREHRAA
jgi:hypothetical protein